MNFFDQGLSLGRWFGIKVILHTYFLIWAAWEIAGDYSRNPQHLPVDILILLVLFATVLLHEFGHALSCKALGGDAPQIILWPLGGVAFVQPPHNPTAWLITTVCGPLVNAILWPIFYLTSAHLHILSADDLLFFSKTHTGVALYAGTASFWSWQINRLLLIFNLIPAYPMDGGRIFQELLWYGIGYARSRLIAGAIGIVCGGAFIVLGFGLWHFTLPIVHYTLGQGSDYILIAIGFLSAMQSYFIIRQALQELHADPDPNPPNPF